MKWDKLLFMEWHDISYDTITEYFLISLDLLHTLQVRNYFNYKTTKWIQYFGFGLY